MDVAVDYALQFAHAATAIVNAGTVQDAVEAIREIYNLDHATYHHQPLGGKGPEAPYVKSTYPAEWLTRYLLCGYIHVDPVVLAGFSRLLPFDWHAIEWTEKAKDFMLDAFAHGLGGNGYSVPLIDKRVRRALFSINSRMPRPKWESFIAACAVEFAKLGMMLHRRVIAELYGSADPLPNLSSRELECLAWSAQGLEVKEVAIQIGISEHTVRTHLKGARHKLGDGALSQTIARAIRLRLVEP